MPSKPNPNSPTSGRKQINKIHLNYEILTNPKRKTNRGFEGKSFKDYLVSVGYLAPEVVEQSTEQR